MSQTAQLLTAEEYLVRERACEFRNELIGGVMRPMPPSNVWHATISSNLVVHIHTALRGRECQAFGIGMRLKVPATGLYTYADVAGFCEEPLAEDAYDDTLVNPSVIIEVLSDRTEAYDRGGKFAHYRRLDSLREYILVSQNLPLVEQYLRNGELWTLKAIEGLDETLSIETLGCTLSLAEIYDRVEFPPPGERERG